MSMSGRGTGGMQVAGTLGSHSPGMGALPQATSQQQQMPMPLQLMQGMPGMHPGDMHTAHIAQQQQQQHMQQGTMQHGQQGAMQMGIPAHHTLPHIPGI